MMKLREFGDFQTPRELVRTILRVLGPIRPRWQRVLEPTCGQGNFIIEILRSDLDPSEIIGIELQDHHIQKAKRAVSEVGSKARVRIIKGSIFDINVAKLSWESTGPLLVVGNPPWVTNSEIGALQGNNLPQKSNFKGMRGIEAITGSSNFDIAEFIWLKLIEELQSEDATIALLCKTSVARNVLLHSQQAKLGISNARMYKIDAKKWFGAAVDACLFTLDTGSASRSYEVEMFESLGASRPTKRVGFVNGRFVTDMTRYGDVSFIEGSTPIEWRQGIKHDAAKIMELIHDGRNWINGFGERVEVEDEHIFPLLKGSDLRRFAQETKIPRRGVIVPQKEVHQDTRHLAFSAPRLWAYLRSHESHFNARKSSIYKNKPPYSVFGIGGYSFAKYKVIVSGLYKKPLFVAVGLIEGKPVLCDDTCYLLPCETALQAATIAALLNHPLSIQFLESIAPRDAKRPIKKSVLQRIDLLSLAERVSFDDVKEEIEKNLCRIHATPPQLQSSQNLSDLLGIPQYPTQAALFS